MDFTVGSILYETASNTLGRKLFFDACILIGKPIALTFLTRVQVGEERRKKFERIPIYNLIFTDSLK